MATGPRRGSARGRPFDLEDLPDPDPDAVVIPCGGGGLTTGIASAIKALRRQTRIVTAEPETAAALSVALDAGHPVTLDYRASFIDGCVPPGRQPGREAGTEPVSQRTSGPVRARPMIS
jgi:hypothetical protein